MDVDRFTESDKFLTVMNWLKLVFGDEPIPSFSKEDELIQHLSELRTTYEHLQTKSDYYTQFCDVSRSRDYDHHLILVKDTLKSIGLPADRCSEAMCSEILASIANNLALSDVDKNGYLLALSDLALQKDKTVSECDTLGRVLDQGKCELSESVNVTSQLEDLTMELNKKHTEQKIASQSHKKETEFLFQKVNKYNSDKRKQEDKLARSGVTSSVTHDRLVLDHAELKDLTSKLNNTKEQLQMFSDLPPDIQLARVRLELARAELHDIENELANQIDMFHI